MNRKQKIVMWVFGILISLGICVYGSSLTDQYGDATPNGFIAYIVPLILIGLMSFATASNKSK